MAGGVGTAANLSPGSPAARCTKSDRQSGGLRSEQDLVVLPQLEPFMLEYFMLVSPTMSSSPPRVGVPVSHQWGTNPVHVLLQYW